MNFRYKYLNHVIINDYWLYQNECKKQKCIKKQQQHEKHAKQEKEHGPLRGLDLTTRTSFRNYKPIVLNISVPNFFFWEKDK
jgi:hypothetical protein